MSTRSDAGTVSPFTCARRAMQLIVTDKTVTITIRPAPICINPVFELADAPKTLVHVQLAVEKEEYAWDGKTLWIRTIVRQDTPLQLEFESPDAS